MSVQLSVVDSQVLRDLGISQNALLGHSALKQLYPEQYDKPVTETFTHPAQFEPPTPDDSPKSLFFKGQREMVPGPRFVRGTNRDQILIYTDGACRRNGQAGAVAGWGFVFRPPGITKSGKAHDGTVRGRLEVEGPTGILAAQTSNRAELRAVIAALQFRAWHGEGWTKLVIATDSEYVVKGATIWVHRWMLNGWLTAKNSPVLNRDLWELLLEEVRRKGDCGMEILFWRIPREWNDLADQKAKEAVSGGDIQAFIKTHGVMV